MKLKAIVTGLVIAGVLTTQAYAASVAQPGAAFSNSDIQSLFVDNQQPLQLAPLSAQEMQMTRGGGLLQNVMLAQGLTGAMTNTGIYALTHLNSEFNAVDLVASTASGFVVGAIGGQAYNMLNGAPLGMKLIMSAVPTILPGAATYNAIHSFAN